MIQSNLFLLILTLITLMSPLCLAQEIVPIEELIKQTEAHIEQTRKDHNEYEQKVLEVNQAVSLLYDRYNVSQAFLAEINKLEEIRFLLNRINTNNTYCGDGTQYQKNIDQLKAMAKALKMKINNPKRFQHDYDKNGKWSDLFLDSELLDAFKVLLNLYKEASGPFSSKHLDLALEQDFDSFLLAQLNLGLTPGHAELSRHVLDTHTTTQDVSFGFNNFFEQKMHRDKKMEFKQLLQSKDPDLYYWLQLVFIQHHIDLVEGVPFELPICQIDISDIENRANQIRQLQMQYFESRDMANSVRAIEMAYDHLATPISE